MSCEFGSQKREGAVDYINEDDIGVFCFAFGLEGDACRLLDLVPSIVKQITKLKKPNSTDKDADIIGKLLIKVAKEGYRIAVNQQDQIVVEGYCQKPAPPLPTDITLIDIYRFIAGLVPIIDLFFTGLEIVISAESLLLYKIVGFYLYQKWYENCECKKPPVIRGCTDRPALNFNPNATEDDGSCRYPENQPPVWIYGCTDSRATNYNPDANFDDSTCVYQRIENPLTCDEGYEGYKVRVIDARTYPDINYVPKIFNDFYEPLSSPQPLEGFVYFDENAVGTDRGYLTFITCTSEPPPPIEEKPPQAFCTLYPDDPLCNVLGCTDPNSLNYNPLASINDGSCVYDVLGCTDPNAGNYNPDATIDDGSCVYDVLGCTDPNAGNYNPDATIDDGSCDYERYGCTDPLADNYDDTATIDDGSCIYYIRGCTDPNALNYDPQAQVNDGSCQYSNNGNPVYGCKNPNACNYNPQATIDDGSCRFCDVINVSVVEFSECGSDRSTKTVQLFDCGQPLNVSVVEFTGCSSDRTTKTMQLLDCG